MPLNINVKGKKKALLLCTWVTMLSAKDIFELPKAKHKQEIWKVVVMKKMVLPVVYKETSDELISY